MSIFKDNLLAKNASFITSADALLKSSIQQERFRAVRALEALDRVRDATSDGTPFNRLLGNLGELSNIIAASLGTGSKMIGPISELPLIQRAQLSDIRYTKTHRELRNDRDKAMRRTPDIGVGIDADSISILPGGVGITSNRFGPKSAGMISYSEGEGAERASNYVGRVFPFEIVNLARTGNATLQHSTSTSDSSGKPKDLSREIFPAYIGALNEQVNATWGSNSYIGRSEELYMYNGASRSLNLDIVLFATNDDQPVISRVVNSPSEPVATFDNGYELPVSKLIGASNIIPQDEAIALMDNSISKTDLWRKINFLTSLCYPAYDEDNRWSRSPFARLTLGSLFDNQLIIVNSISMSYDPLVWDINGEHFTPMFVNVTIAITVIHETSPGILPDGSFGFKDFDGNTRFLHRSDFS